MSRRRCDELGGKKLLVKLGRRRRRMDVVIDLCCGTATSASKFYLLKNKNAIVIGIDHGHGCLSDLPSRGHYRYCTVRGELIYNTPANTAITLLGYDGVIIIRDR